MKSFLKKLLLNVAEGARDTAFGMLPGSELVVKAATALLDKDDSNNAQAIKDLEDGLISVLNSLPPNQVTNSALVMAGIEELKSGFEKIRQGLKK